jgi:hypothetical protein
MAWCLVKHRDKFIFIFYFQLRYCKCWQIRLRNQVILVKTTINWLRRMEHSFSSLELNSIMLLWKATYRQCPINNISLDPLLWLESVTLSADLLRQFKQTRICFSRKINSWLQKLTRDPNLHTSHNFIIWVSERGHFVCVGCMRSLYKIVRAVPWKN